MIALREATGNLTLDTLQDYLSERDIYDPLLGPAESWPAWTDEVQIGDGPPLAWCEELPDPEDPEDWDDRLDHLERERYEAGCRMRFA